MLGEKESLKSSFYLFFGTGIFLLIIALIITLNLKNVIEPKKETSKKLIAINLTLGILMIGLAVIN